MRTNWLKQELLEGKPVVGLMVGELRTPNLGRLLDAAGADFVVLDQEHGVYGPELLANILVGFRGGRCAPIVRVPEIRKEYFSVALDQGAVGIMVPGVESAEDAARCVEYCKYPPEGTRGLNALRAHTEFRPPAQADLLRETNDAVLLILQIETARGVEQVDHIFAVPGVDVGFAGCADLSASLGVKNDPDLPCIKEALAKIIAAGKRHNVITGIHAYDPQRMAGWNRDGMQFFSGHTDVRAILDAWGGRMSAVRAALTGGQA